MMAKCKSLTSRIISSRILSLNFKSHRQLAQLRSIAAECLVVALLFYCVGCGSDRLPTHPVEGSVRFEDGSKVMFGDIEFYSVDHQLNARGKIGRDGTFTVGTYAKNDGAVAGKHQVIVLQITGDYLTEKLGDQIKHDHGELIDSAFFDYRTSGLECTIVPGRNPVKLTVRKNPRQTDDGLPEN